MIKDKLERKDFHVVANGRGYQIQYKGQNIGGAGISRDAKGPRGRGVWPQVQDYFRMGNSDIEAIVAGTGKQRFYAVIERIEAENLCPDCPDPANATCDQCLLPTKE